MLIVADKTKAIWKDINKEFMRVGRKPGYNTVLWDSIT